MRNDDDHTAGLPLATTTGTGLGLAVRLTPRAARNGLDGVALGRDGRPAPPMEGAANAALVAYVAEALRLRRSDVAIVSARRGRLKLLALSGDADTPLARLAEWVEEARRP